MVFEPLRHNDTKLEIENAGVKLCAFVTLPLCVKYQPLRKKNQRITQRVPSLQIPKFLIPLRLIPEIPLLHFHKALIQQLSHFASTTVSDGLSVHRQNGNQPFGGAGNKCFGGIHQLD